MLIVDSNLDLAYNAIEFNRDPRQPVQAIRGRTETERKASGTVYLFNHSIAARFDAISTVE